MIRKVLTVLKLIVVYLTRITIITAMIYNVAFVISTYDILQTQNEKTNVIAAAVSTYQKAILEQTYDTHEPNYTKLLNTNVLIYNMTQGCLGAGTVIKIVDTTYILSAAHLGDLTDLFYMSEREILIPIKLIKADHVVDLALFKPTAIPDTLEVATLASKEPTPGTRVWAVGNPAEIEDAITSGEMIKKAKFSYIIDAPIYFGNSGGGLFNVKGELLGVNVSLTFYPPHYTLGTTVGLKAIKAFLEEFNTPKVV